MPFDTRKALSRLLCGVAAAPLLAVMPLSAMAQSAPPDRIDAIEHQIQALQGQMQQLKGELDDTKQQLRQSRSETAQAKAELRQARDAAARAKHEAQSAAVSESNATQAAADVRAKVATVAALPPAPAAPPLPPPGPHVVQTPGNRFGLASADGRNSIYLTGRIQFDAGDYLSYNPQSKFASVQKLDSGVNLRRGRLGVIGTFAGDWDYNLTYDFGGSSDGLPPTSGAPTSGVEIASLTYNGLYKRGFPLVFDVGYLDTQFTLQEAMSSNDILMLERASIVNVATSIMAGDFRSAVGARSYGDRYWAGAYLTGPASGANHAVGTGAEQVGAFGRGTYQVVQTPEASLHLGFDVGGLMRPPSSGGVATITLSERPELRIDPTSILSTGSLGTAAHPVTDAVVYGVEAAAEYRDLFIEGEYYQIAVDRNGLSGNTFDGGYVEGSWIITGESRPYVQSSGAYTNPVPNHPFSPWDGEHGLGAWELVGRFSTISLNDNFTPGVAPASTSNAVGGGTQTVYGIGLNWYPNRNVRFMLDYLHGDIDKKFSTAAGGGITGTPLGSGVGGSYDALALRTQVAF
jgi:phosphate-selective porin OprO/OprP